MIERMQIAKYRFTLEAGRQGLDLPVWKASTFRGTFGHVFKKLACIHPYTECATCEAAAYCAYPYIFETKPDQDEGFMGKYEQIPRPYVLEAPLDQQMRYEPGALMTVDLVLFGKAIDYAPLFVAAFREMGHQGLGKGRKPAALIHAENLDALEGNKHLVYAVGQEQLRHTPLVMSGATIVKQVQKMSLPRQLMLFFDTPLRMKWQGGYTAQPDFHIVFRNAVRRITSLLRFHHESVALGDVRALLDRAEQVRLVRHSTRWHDQSRYSSRQDEHMKLGGIVGWAQYEYDGDWTEFWSWLKIAEMAHVGKNAVFDLGRVRLG